MVRNLLVRGMLVGILAGLLAFGFAKIFGEPQIDRAIAFETQMNAAKGEAPEPELVSRKIQSTIGLATGVVVYGAALGGIFSLVFAYANGRVGRIGPRSLAGLLALAGFVLIALVPDLKYPANPPSIGNPDTIGMRTAWYFVMIVLSISAAVVALNLLARLRPRQGMWNACIAAAAVFIGIMVLAMLLLPTIDEVPNEFSAVLLWRFRVASLGIHAVTWSCLGLVFGYLTERKLDRKLPANWRPAR